MSLRLFYRTLNMLSVDVAIGAMCGALFFAKLLQVQVLIYGIAALGLSVWIIYTTDHLLDAKRIGRTASTDRHRFHQQHFDLLVRLVVVAVLVNIMLIFFVRERVLLGGLFLSGGVGIYLIINHYLKILKELLISILYTCGVLMPSIMVTSFAVKEIPWLVVSQFVLVAFLNLLVFSCVDIEHDTNDGTDSFATKAGQQTTNSVLVLVFVCSVLMGFFSTDVLASAILIVMAVVQLLVYFSRHLFLKEDYIRMIGEAVFMLPLLYLLW